MSKHLFTLGALLISAGMLFAQSSNTNTAKTPSNVFEAFRMGTHSGNLRSYMMATDNAPHLSDYRAWAVGGALHFNTAAFHGFSFGMGGAYVYNASSFDLTQKDSITGSSNRYEIGLFDVENTSNRGDLDRLEELWLRYAVKKTRITVGNQIIQSPLINYQDGRMRPTAEAGLWVESEDLKNTRIEGGWLWGISPRSTVHWYDIGESIGLYPKGLNPDGTASGYPQNIESKGIGLLGITRQWNKNVKTQLWDQYVENVFNTAFFQIDATFPLKHQQKIVSGLQLMHQDALGNGGNESPSKTYFPTGAQSNTISAQAGWQKGQWQALAAWTHITGDGRFLSPREWGREPFYTFMPRERVEGSGRSHSVTGRAIWQDKHQKMRIEAAYGQFYLPDVKNAAFNKYAFPAFRQINLDARYTFGGALKGLRAQLLYVWKGRIGDIYNNQKYVINKVDMSLYNFIINYTF